MAMIVEGQTIRGGLTVRDCTILVKKGQSGLFIQNNLILAQPTWRHPVQRFRFWRKWVSDD